MDDEREWLAERFEERRLYIRAVAYNMLGSPREADEVVREVWLRFTSSMVNSRENLSAWLTSVVARVCVEMLVARNSSANAPGRRHVPVPCISRQGNLNSTQETVLADSLGIALLVALEALDPDERLAFVLRQMFDVPFDEIAAIIECSPTVAKQLASRARRRVGKQPPAKC